jgi:hypothetical protein
MSGNTFLKESSGMPVVYPQRLLLGQVLQVPFRRQHRLHPLHRPEVLLLHHPPPPESLMPAKSAALAEKGASMGAVFSREKDKFQSSYETRRNPSENSVASMMMTVYSIERGQQSDQAFGDIDGKAQVWRRCQFYKTVFQSKE